MNERAFAESVVERAALGWLEAIGWSVTRNKHVRRADMVLFVNGLPLAILELTAA